VTARLSSLSKGAQVALVVTMLLLVVAVGWFALISPKRSTAADLKKQTAAVNAQIAANRSSAFTQALPAVRSASVFRLAMAMPSQLQTPDVVLQLNSLALASGISFDQIQPGAVGAGTGAAAAVNTDPFATEPIQVKFSGSFYNLLAFLQRMRNLVRVENGRLFTAGRLFDVSNIEFAQGTQGWPQIQASLTINAFVPQSAAPLTSTTPGATDTTSTTTTGTTTTSNSTSAAPSTNGGTS
jgi:Tfp pilus assembly protein PilO